MDREAALEKIAWYHLKKLTRDEATNLIIEFFDEPLKPSLREKLNITAVIQWETHQPPTDFLTIGGKYAIGIKCHCGIFTQSQAYPDFQPAPGIAYLSSPKFLQSSRR